MGKINGNFFSELNKNKILYIMFIPIFIYYILFAYIPMTGIVMAFKEFNYRDGIWFSPWIWFKNFEFFFKSGKALQVTINTVLYNLIFLICSTFFAVLVAIFIADIKGKIFKKLCQSSMILPYFISWVVVAAMIYNFFNYDFGVMNRILAGLKLQPINIYSTPEYWTFILPFMYTWKNVGYLSIIYLASITGIDPQLYEAATIDGASMFQRIRYITLPAIRPTMIILILLAVGQILRGQFDMFWNLIGNNGLLIDKTDIVDTLVWRSLLGTQDYGMASAAGFYQSVLCFVIIVTVNGIVRKIDSDYALF